MRIAHAGIVGAVSVAVLVGVLTIGSSSFAAPRAAAASPRLGDRVVQAGTCSQDHGFRLGAVFNDGVVAVPACGPIPLESSCNTTENCPVYPYPGAGTPYPGYQCAELPARYLWYQFHAAEQLANGDGQAATYVAAFPRLFTLIHNGTVDHAPQEGDVISMSANANFQDGDGGHVAIVQSVSAGVASTGTGTIHLVDQNDTSSGTNTLAIKGWRVQEGINYYSYFEWLHPKVDGIGGPDVSGQVATGHDASGTLQLFMVGADHHVYTRYQTSATAWSSTWSSLSGSFASGDALGVATNAKGELELLAVAGNGGIDVDTQKTDNDYLGWTGWTSIGGGGLFPQDQTALNVADNANGDAQAFVVGQDGEVYTSAQSASGAWSGWTAIGGNFGRDGELGLGVNTTGKLQLFALGPTGQLLSDLQVAPNETLTWHGWDPLEGGNFPGDVGAFVGADEDGKLQLYDVTTTGTLDTSYLTSGWSPFRSLGGALNRADSVGTTILPSGKQQVFAVGTNGVLDAIYEVTPDAPASWHPWSTLDPSDSWPTTDDVAVATDSTGHPHVFLVGHNGSLYTAYQNAANAWIAFSSLGGAWPSE